MIILKSTHEKVVTNFVNLISEKNDNIARVNDELAVASRSKEILENRNYELSSKLVAANNNCENKQNTIDELQEVIKEHKEYADSISNEKEKLSKRLNTHIKQISQLEDANHELHQDLEDATQTINQIDMIIKQIESEKAKLEKDMSSVREDNINIVKRNKHIWEIKRQFEEKIKVACKWSFIDLPTKLQHESQGIRSNIKLSKEDIKKLNLTLEDTIDLLTLIGLM